MNANHEWHAATQYAAEKAGGNKQWKEERIMVKNILASPASREGGGEWAAVTAEPARSTPENVRRKYAEE